MNMLNVVANIVTYNSALAVGYTCNLLQVTSQVTNTCLFRMLLPSNYYKSNQDITFMKFHLPLLAKSINICLNNDICMLVVHALILYDMIFVFIIKNNRIYY